MNVHRGNASMSLLVVGSLVLLALLLLILWLDEEDPSTIKEGTRLRLYCAAGLTHPVKAAADEYRDELGIQVEIQDATYNPIPGYGQSDCPTMIGDKIEGIVSWRKGTKVKTLQGKPIRLRFVMKDADLFSLRFR